MSTRSAFAAIVPCLALACGAATESASPHDEPATATSAEALTMPTNLVADGSFEKQTTSAVAAPWQGGSTTTIESTGAPPHGKKNALVQGASGWNAVQQWVAVKPFSHYSASVAVATSPNLTSAYFSARGNQTFAVINEVPFGATGAGWSTLRFEFDTGADTSVLLYVGFWGNGANATLRVDDLTLMTETSVLANGSFESGLSPWFGGTIETSGQHSGAGAALVRGTTGWNATNQWLTVAKNAAYHVTGWIRTSANVGDGYLSIRGNAQESTLDVINEAHFGPMTGSYRLVTFDFNSGNNSSVLLYAGYWAPGADSQIEVDDVAVTPAGDPNAFYECEHMTDFFAGGWPDDTVPIGEPLILHLRFQRQPGLPESQGTVTVDGAPYAIEYPPEDGQHPAGFGYAELLNGAPVTSNTPRMRTATLRTACGTETRTIALNAVSPTAPHTTLWASATTIKRGGSATLTWRTYVNEPHSVCGYFTSKMIATRASDGAVTGSWIGGASGGQLAVAPTETTDYTVVSTCTDLPAVTRRTTLRIGVVQPSTPPPPPGGACGTTSTGVHQLTVVNQTLSDTLTIWRSDEATGAENDDGDVGPGQSLTVTIPNCRWTDVAAISREKVAANNAQWGTTYDPHDAQTAQHFDFASSVVAGILGSDSGITTPVDPVY